jgi:DnaJ-class molecular chaperone
VADNLYARVSISLLEALTGFQRTLKHLDDAAIELKRTGITPHGTLPRLDLH